MTANLAPTQTAPAGPAVRLRPRLRRVRYEPEPGTVPRGSGADAPPPLPARSEPPPPEITAAEIAEVHRRITRALRTVLEVFDGRRPAAHLTGLLDAPALRYWRVATARRRLRSPARFRRIRLCMPRPGVAEVAVACEIDGRVRALAARFELPEAPEPGAGWRCTALRLG